MDAQCQALNLSDETRCIEIATSYEGRFCWFHAKQCYGLYVGYKRRNARLDYLTDNPPKYLAETKDPLGKEKFTRTEDEDVLNEVYSYLHEQFNLFTKVIEARRLHQSRFFSVELDYGHQVYIDKLRNRKFHVERALERLTRRIAEVLYNKQRWFEWARETQEDEESNRQSEKVKLQRENAMFKRHAKELGARLTKARAKENERKQDQFLDAAYKERLAEEDVDTWDPIQDELEDVRAKYTDLIRHFLWLPAENLVKEDEKPPLQTSEESVQTSAEPEQTAAELEAANGESSTVSKKKKKKKKKPQAQAQVVTQQPQQQPNKDNIETLDQLRERLAKGSVMADLPAGAYFAGSIETPEALWNRTAPMSSDEVEAIVDDIKQVKLFIFCRLLLSRSKLLPLAVKANTVEEFLAHPKVLDTDLRELCLDMERPALQTVRDACADLARGENEAEAIDDEVEEEEVKSKETRIFKNEKLNQIRAHEDVGMFNFKRKRDMPRNWQSKREGERKKRFEKLFPGEEAFVDFGVKEEDDVFQRRKVRVRLCGHWIWNYASDSDMKRSGWLLFSVMTQCSLFNATELCRSWNELYELSVLTIFNYFPASFRTWTGDRFKQQLLMMGFMPYMIEARAEDMTVRQQTGARSHHGRQHMFPEARPYICGQMKRNDPVTRRFIQYMSMMTSEVCILARDGKGGKILIEPPEEERWLKRSKMGIGRATKNQWQVLQSVGLKFFEDMDAKRTWGLSFDDYYDVYIWATEAGENFNILCTIVHDTLWKARRITDPKQMYDQMAPILSTITRDPKTHRARDIMPDEKVKSIYQDISEGKVLVGSLKAHDLSGEMLENDPRTLRKILYNEADALEDAVLFSDELLNGEASGKFEELSNTMLKFERSGPSMARWLVGAEFDEGLSDYYSEDDDEEDDDESDDDGNYNSEDDAELKRLIEMTQLDSDIDEWSTETESEHEDVPSANKIAKAAKKMSSIANSAKAKSKDANRDDRRSYLVKDDEMSMLPYEFEHVDKAQARQDRQRGTKRGWENAFAAIMLAEQTQTAQVPDTVADWLWGMFENEETALDIPKDPGLAHDKWMEWMEKDRSRAFKEMFHAVDPAPFNQQWKESLDLLKMIEAWEIGDVKRGSFVISQLINMGVKGAARTRRAYRDMARAFAQVSIFFPDLDIYSMKEFLEENEAGQKFKDSLLLKPEERARVIPQCRSREGNQTRPDEFFDDYIQNVFKVRGHISDKIPADWDVCIRPIIAKLYKEGLLAPAHRAVEDIKGQAIAVKEDGKDHLDMFVFYNTKYDDSVYGHIEHPSKWPDIKKECRLFADKEPKARFAILRIHSNPYFYPSMLGPSNQRAMGFVDSTGRGWNWKFLPKDHPGSERSVHWLLHQCLEKYRHKLKLGKQVRVRRDAIMVMGVDQEDLARLCMGVCYAVQSRPWIREIDVWKSFVNVDVGFVEGLDRWWVE